MYMYVCRYIAVIFLYVAIPYISMLIIHFVSCNNNFKGCQWILYGCENIEIVIVANKRLTYSEICTIWTDIFKLLID